MFFSTSPENKGPRLWERPPRPWSDKALYVDYARGPASEFDRLCRGDGSHKGDDRAAGGC
jgi:hypothetical protein